MDRKHAGTQGSHNSQQGGRSAAKPKALVVIDSTIQDHQALASEALPEAEILLLDPLRDGVQQITEALQQRHMTHVHIFSHGSCESLSLGSARLNLDTLEYYAWDLQAWFPAHAFVIPSVQLHGCGAAVCGTEVEFLERLHQLTGASIDTSDLAKCCVGVGG